MFTPARWPAPFLPDNLDKFLAAAPVQHRSCIKGGATSYLEVLDSETRYFAAQLTLAQAQLSELHSLVQICCALGGGWQQQQ
ncbi:MAG: oprM 1 [Candidatus Angelobacter sp.]|jgi:hypothetical protein|nr:oprM 1 [Candidatus Angelobacter sp.]